MTQVPQVDGPASLTVELERLAELVDQSNCPGAAATPGQVLAVRAVPLGESLLTVVWSGVVNSGPGGPAHPTQVLACVTLNLDDASVLTPGADQATNTAAITALVQSIDPALSLDRLGDWLSQTDQWVHSVPETPSSLLNDWTYVLVPVPYAIGGWLPIALSDNQARIADWRELTG